MKTTSLRSTNKPHVKFHARLKDRQWFMCMGSGVAGYGLTIKGAYVDWRHAHTLATAIINVQETGQ